MAELEITFHDGKKFLFVIPINEKTITVGRAPTNTITLNDTRVSRHHARITRGAEGYRIEDLNSQNGICIDKKKITRHLLAHNDILNIGSCTLRFLDEPHDAPDVVHTVAASSGMPRFDDQTMLVKKSRKSDETGSHEQSELEKNNKILYMLYQLSKQLHRNADLKQLLKTIMDVLFDVIEADYGFIAILDAARSTLIPQVIKYRHDRENRTEEFRVSRTIMEQVIGKKTSILTSNAMKDFRLGSALSIRQQNLQSVISAPLWRRDEVIGIIQLDSCRWENQFQTSDLELVSSISWQIAMILDQAYLIELQRKHQFVRETFGRYLSDDVVKAILESPDGLNMGGEKREVTILMSDLRGFTAISERLPAVEVVEIINIYLEVMTEIILAYRGTIDEFIGDAILAIFGAPLKHADDAQRAVACAIAMQNAMAGINATLARKGYADISMGIGINTGSVAVGNVGSKKRTKYGVVGRNVNLTSRIESYTVGGQILLSDATRRACGTILRINEQMQVMPKGVKEPILIYDVVGIEGDFQVFLPVKHNVQLKEMSPPLPVKIYALEGKHANKKAASGCILRLSMQWADIQTELAYPKFTNLKLTLFDGRQSKITEELYAKVLSSDAESPDILRVNFTAVPPEARIAFQQYFSTKQPT